MTAATRSRKRRQLLAREARELGLTYRREDLLDLPIRYGALTILREGHDRRARDVIYGPTEFGSATCFSYEFDTGFGVHGFARRFKVAVLETDGEYRRTVLAGSNRQGMPSCFPVAAVGARLVAGDDEGNWAESHRGPGSYAPPTGLIPWMARSEREMVIETHGRLIAIAVPLEPEPHVTWMMTCLADVARFLSRAVLERAGEEAPPTQNRPPRSEIGHD